MSRASNSQCTMHSIIRFLYERQQHSRLVSLRLPAIPKTNVKTHACLNHLVLAPYLLAGLINFSDDADNASLEGLVNAVEFAQRQIVLRLGVPLAALIVLLAAACGCGCHLRTTSWRRPPPASRVGTGKRKTD
jgi:hypothetical protein